MKPTATIRELRNQFPRIRKLVETEGEVLLTERGSPRYRLTLYSPEAVREPPPVDYWSRLSSYQPDDMSPEQADALHNENRGDR